MVRVTSETETPRVPVGGGVTRGPHGVWDLGADEAFATLCACVRPLLLRYVFDEIDDAELAAEIVEETLRRARFGAYARGEGAGDVVGWVLGIADRLVTAALHQRTLEHAAEHDDE